MGIDQRQAQGRVGPQIGLYTPGDQTGKIILRGRRNIRVDLDDGQAWAREQSSEAQMPRRKTRHDPIEANLAEGHRRQGGENLVANHQRIVVVAARIRGDNQPIEPIGVAPLFGQLAAFDRARLRLSPVVHQPAARDQLAVGVVEIRALLVAVDVAPVRLGGVVGIAPLSAAVLVEQLLRHVPTHNRGIQRPHQHAWPLGIEADFTPFLPPQAVAVIRLRSGL